MQYSSIISHIVGMLFLGMPHHGSDLAGTLNHILCSTPGLSSRIYISELEKGSESLQGINDQFRTVCANDEHISLYKIRKTNLLLGICKLIQSKTFTIITTICSRYSSSSRRSLQYSDIQQSNLVDSMLIIITWASLSTLATRTSCTSVRLDDWRCHKLQFSVKILQQENQNFWGNIISFTYN